MTTAPEEQPTRPTPPPEASRTCAARRRVRSLKVGAAVAATGVFAATAAAAHRSHPGGVATTGGALEPPRSFTEQVARSDFFGRGSFGPGDTDDLSMPSTSTHTS